MVLKVELPSEDLGRFLSNRLEEFMFNEELMMLIDIDAKRVENSISIKYAKYLVSDEDIKRIMDYDKNAVNFFEKLNNGFLSISTNSKKKLTDKEADVTFIMYCANFLTLIHEIKEKSQLIVEENLC